MKKTRKRDLFLDPADFEAMCRVVLKDNGDREAGRLLPALLPESQWTFDEDNDDDDALEELRVHLETYALWIMRRASQFCHARHRIDDERAKAARKGDTALASKKAKTKKERRTLLLLNEEDLSNAWNAVAMEQQAQSRRQEEEDE